MDYEKLLNKKLKWELNIKQCVSINDLIFQSFNLSMFQLTNQLTVNIIDNDLYAFPNCMENTIANVIRLLHYDAEKKIYNFTKNENLNKILKIMPYEEDLIFFSRYVNFIDNKNIQYVRNTNNEMNLNYELETSLLNFIIILDYLLDLEIMSIPISISLSIKELKEILINKINDKYKDYIFDIQMYVSKDDGEYSYIVIKHKSEETMEYSITLQKYIHAEMNIIYN